MTTDCYNQKHLTKCGGSSYQSIVVWGYHCRLLNENLPQLIVVGGGVVVDIERLP